MYKSLLFVNNNIGDYMNENKEMLVLLHKNINMGIESCSKLLDLLKNKDNKIKNLLEEELQRYESLFKRCKSLMKKNDIARESSDILAAITSSIAMSFEVNKDNSDSKIASILIRGFNMGNIDIEAKIKDYNNSVSEDIIILANDLLNFGEEQIKLLKEFL